jgi:hypothetical protein
MELTQAHFKQIEEYVKEHLPEWLREMDEERVIKLREGIAGLDASRSDFGGMNDGEIER